MSKPIINNLRRQIADTKAKPGSMSVGMPKASVYIADLEGLISGYEALTTALADARADLVKARGEVGLFADGVIDLITTEQAAMSRLYSAHTYGINKVCNRLKLFVGDLLKETPEPSQLQGETNASE
jgi:hypothetical protein